VKSGDSLLRIAFQFGTTIGVLQEYNNISNPNLIRIGQLIRIPATAPGGGTAAPSPTPTPTPTPSPEPTPEAEVVDQSYRVQSGDTLIRIAAKFGVTTSALQQLNNISNPNSIRIGQVLKIPTGTESTSVPEAAAPEPEAAEPTTYRVQAGDTLWGIARKFGIRSSVLASLNGITNVNLIRVGQLLRVSD
jgi:peptidoglycan endopeptidase LytF